MIDLNFIRQNPEKVKDIMIKKKSSNSSIVDKFLKLDEQRVEYIQKIDSLKQQRNEISSKGGKPSPKEIEKVKRIKDEISELEEKKDKVEQEWNELYSLIPNIPRDDTPEGTSEDYNIDVYAWTPNDKELKGQYIGKPNSSREKMPLSPPHSAIKFAGKHHIDIGKALDIIDNEQSAITSGTRFTYIKKEGFLLQYAAFELLKNKLLEEGFIPMIVPLLVKERILFGTSHFPEGKDQVYRIDNFNVEDNNQLYLVGSSEPPLFGYYTDKTVSATELPIKMFAFTSCFRSEVGSWGKDTRGIKRVHQFDKLEMDIICHPDESNYYAEEYLLGINKWFLQTLEIPFRIVRKCYGDMGYQASHAQWDTEAWLPSQKEFMEVGTSTNTTDFQARRLNIHFKNLEGKKQLVHTVNDTGAAMGRLLIAIIDNYQQPDGSVVVPSALQKYVGKSVIR